MSSRLTRMLLINAKTSGTRPSGMITEIDPRDGAAITGENGVGKTTTLQLFPLFFGCPPSRIISAGGSMQAMLRFVLPTPESAIVFEYQRGNADDICFVTIRRQEGLDAPEYRFFKGAYRPELFVHDAADGNGSIFYNDAGTVAAADQLGIARERKLDGSQYRAVILRMRTQARDQSNLRNLAQHYSFARRSLQHLDRLVANVVKETVDFKDFITLALSMIYESMGGVGSATTHTPQQLRLRQTQEQIQTWLNNRDAAERALALQPLLEKLRETLTKSRHTQYQLGLHKAELIQCEEHLHTTLKALDDAEEHAQSERQAQEAQEHQQGVSLQAQHARTQAEAMQQQEQLQEMAIRAKRYRDEQAEQWAPRMHELTSLQLKKKQQEEQLALLEEKVQHITSKIDKRRQQLRTDAAQQVVSLQTQKEQHHQDYSLAANKVKERLSTLLQDQQTVFERQMEQQQQRIAQANQQLGICKTAIEHPTVAAQFQDALDATAASLHRAQKTLSHVMDAQATANARRHLAQQSYNALESAHYDSKVYYTKTEEELRQAQIALQPETGTLLAQLRQMPPEEWQHNLARVIDPELLLRTDLAPQPPTEINDSTKSLYGWLLNVDAIATPSWSDDTALQQALNECQQRKDQAYAQEQLSFKQLKEAAAELADAETICADKDAERQIADRRTAQLTVDYEAQQLARERAREEAKIHAVAALKSAQIALEETVEVRKQLERQYQVQCTTIKEECDALLEEHAARRDTALHALDEQIKAVETHTDRLLEDLQQERDRRLVDNQVDHVAVNRLHQIIKALDNDIRRIQSKHYIVEEWLGWIKENGPATLAALESSVAQLKQTQTHEATLIAEHNKQVQQNAQQYRKANNARSEQRDELQLQIAQANQLLAELADVSAASSPPSDAHVLPIAVIRGHIHASQQLATEAQHQLRQYKDRIYNELTSKDSAVKDLVMQHMDAHTNAESSVLEQAQELDTVYRDLGHSVITSVNSSLGPLLENIAEFRKTIARFETHVQSFNKALQVGLAQVSLRTERLRDLEIHIVCDFEKLDYLKKLDQLHSITVDYRQYMSKPISDSVPPVSTAEALRDILALLKNNALEVNLSQHITLKGSANDGGNIKPFNRESELRNLSSTGITAIALITLLSGMLNVVRKDEKIYVPWVTDEVGRFDAKNFQSLMASLRDNHIDVVTASPALTPAMFPHFRSRYVFRPGSRVAVFSTNTLSTESRDTSAPSNFSLRQ